MKLLVLVSNRIKQFALKKKALFVLFILGGIMSTLMFAYMYGNLNPVVSNYTSKEFRYRKYDVSFTYIKQDAIQQGSIQLVSPDRNYVTDEDINNIIDTGIFETIICESHYETPNNVAMAGSDGSPIAPSTSFNDHLSNDIPVLDSLWTCVYGKPYFVLANGALELTNDDQVIVTNGQNISVGRYVNVRDKKLKVVGKTTEIRDVYYVTENTYKDLGAYTNHLILYSKDRWHLNNNVPLITLQKMFPDTHITYSTSEENDLYFAKKEFPSILLNYAITLVAFVFLLDYLTSQLSEENAVSLIVGGRPTDITAMAIIEGMFLSVFAIVIGLVLHHVLYKPVFSYLNVSNIEYRFSDYLIMLLIMVVISVFVMIVRSVKYLRISPFKLRGKVYSKSKAPYIFVVLVAFMTLYSGVISTSHIYNVAFDYLLLKTSKLKNAYYVCLPAVMGNMMKSGKEIEEIVEEMRDNIKKEDFVDKVYGFLSGNTIEYNGDYFGIVLYDPGLIGNFPYSRKFGIDFSKDPDGMIAPADHSISVKPGETINVVFRKYESEDRTVLTDGTIKCTGLLRYPYKYLNLGGSGTIITADKLTNNARVCLMQATENNLRDVAEHLFTIHSFGFIFTLNDNATDEQIEDLLKDIRMSFDVESFDNILKNTKDQIITLARSALIRPVFLLVATIVAFLSVIILMVMRKQHDMAISYLCGADKKDMMLQLLGISLLVTGIPSAVAVLYVIFSPVLQALTYRGLPEFRWNIGGDKGIIIVSDQAWMAAGFFLITVIIAFVTVLISMWKKSPLTYLRELE